MGSLTDFLRAVTLLSLAALALIIAVQMAEGRISARRLLSVKRAVPTPVGGPEPTVDRLNFSRLQLLLVSLGVAGFVLIQAVRSPGAVPDIPAAIVLLLAGSHALYLTRLYLTRKFNNLRPSRTS